MMLVTAAMVVDGPIRSSHSSAARTIGSNGSGLGLIGLEITSGTRHGAGMLVAFSVSPLGGESESVGRAVADAVRVVRESGLPNETSAMFTSVEGEWDEVMDVVKRAVAAVAAHAPRVSLVLKADVRPGHTGQLRAKVERMEQYLNE
jgi:uncharacterized protein (TIGR00106 family)